MPVRALLVLAAVFSQRPIRLEDLPPNLRPSGDFDQLRQALDRDTADRLRRGEDEHLAYFLLQSRTFTHRPPLEPALSAREFIPGESSTPPPAVRARMDDFLRALRRPAVDQRLAYWQLYLPPARRSIPALTAAYTEAMRFLYQKEFQSDPAAYQRRGHSTDTQVEANYAVWTALAVLRRLDPALRLNRVLIIGPGLDFAPRTGLRDDLPPQSYQPYLTADSLLAWQLADPDQLSIHCVDINPRVIRFLENFPRRPQLTLPRSGGNQEYQEYLNQAGRHLGPVLAQSHGRLLRIRPELANRVHTGQLNIVTERYDPSPNFDLIVATNVLTYFPDPQLTLAVANIQAMLRPGGYFLHNELRPSLEALAVSLGMPPIQGRTLEVTKGAQQALLDAFVLHVRR